jgi:hypothetical protein
MEERCGLPSCIEYCRRLNRRYGWRRCNSEHRRFANAPFQSAQQIDDRCVAVVAFHDHAQEIADVILELEPVKAIEESGFYNAVAAPLWAAAAI